MNSRQTVRRAAIASLAVLALLLLAWRLDGCHRQNSAATTPASALARRAATMTMTQTGIPTTTTTSQSPDARIRYLALGDSYTIGQSVDADDRWPVRLA